MDGQGGHQLQGARGPAASLEEELAQLGEPQKPLGGEIYGRWGGWAGKSCIAQGLAQANRAGRE